ncbi:MAG: multidrug effflux MFS transporter [Alphaproteobacteria bacterium]|nr:multidrug effflux MFS transporter [Alphaproteobacteria bacterium]
MSDPPASSYPAAAPKAPILVLVGMMVSSQMAITIHLAALPTLPELLATSQAMVQNTITLYLFAFAIAQLFIGPISDALGRRPVVIAGLGLFSVASIAASFAPNIEFLLAARIVQAVGACAGIALSRAIVRDCFTGQKSVKAMVYLSMAMALMPATAPLIGGGLLVFFGWRSIFVVTGLTGFVVFLAAAATLTETLPRDARRPLHPVALLRGYSHLVAQRTYMAYSASLGCLSGAFNGFLAAIPIVLIAVMGVPEEHFGLYIMPIPVGFIIGSAIAGRLAARHPNAAIVRAGLAINIAAGVALIALTMAGLATPLSILFPLFVFAAGNGLVVPNGLAGSLNAIAPSYAGSAAALTGFMQMSIAALATVTLGLVAFRSAMPMAVVMTVAATASFVAFLVLFRPGPEALTQASD